MTDEEFAKRAAPSLGSRPLGQQELQREATRSRDLVRACLLAEKEARRWTHAELGRACGGYSDFWSIAILGGHRGLSLQHLAIIARRLHSHVFELLDREVFTNWEGEPFAGQIGARGELRDLLERLGSDLKDWPDLVGPSSLFDESGR